MTIRTRSFPVRRRLAGAPSLIAASLLAGAGALGGCATAPGRGADASDPDLKTQMTEMRAALTALTGRMGTLETKLGGLGERIAGTQASLEMLTANHRPAATGVNAHPARGSGTHPTTPVATNDPEAGFLSDAAIQDYRKASILMAAQKYPEAMLGFSTFVERYPDHPLAGSAQYGVGRAYLKQKEYKLAQRELERVLTSYDRSPHISDTLRDLVEADEALRQTDKAARHRQLLTSLFPQSPAAAGSGAAAAAAAGVRESISPAPEAPVPNESGPERTASTGSPVPALESPPTAPITAPLPGAATAETPSRAATAVSANATASGGHGAGSDSPPIDEPPMDPAQ